MNPKIGLSRNYQRIECARHGHLLTFIIKNLWLLKILMNPGGVGWIEEADKFKEFIMFFVFLWINLNGRSSEKEQCLPLPTKSELFAGTFGPEYLKIYCEAKRLEAENFHDHISAREYEWYLF